MVCTYLKMVCTYLKMVWQRYLSRLFEFLSAVFNFIEYRDPLADNPEGEIAPGARRQGCPPLLESEPAKVAKHVVEGEPLATDGLCSPVACGAFFFQRPFQPVRIK
jgi:hypothetical protein